MAFLIFDASEIGHFDSGHHWTGNIWTKLCLQNILGEFSTYGKWVPNGKSKPPHLRIFKLGPLFLWKLQQQQPKVLKSFKFKIWGISVDDFWFHHQDNYIFLIWFNLSLFHFPTSNHTLLFWKRYNQKPNCFEISMLVLKFFLLVVDLTKKQACCAGLKSP